MLRTVTSRDVSTARTWPSDGLACAHDLACPDGQEASTAPPVVTDLLVGPVGVFSAMEVRAQSATKPVSVMFGLKECA